MIEAIKKYRVSWRNDLSSSGTRFRPEDNPDTINWLVTSITRFFSCDIDDDAPQKGSACICVSSTEEKLRKIEIPFDDAYSCTNDKILGVVSERLRRVQRHPDIIVTPMDPPSEPFCLWSIEWADRIRSTNIFQTKFSRILMRLLKLSNACLWSIISSSPKHAMIPDCTKSYQGLPRIIRPSNRLKELMFSGDDIRLADDPGITRGLACVDKTFDLISYHARYDTSLSSPIWTCGVTKTYSYMLVNPLEHSSSLRDPARMPIHSVYRNSIVAKTEPSTFPRSRADYRLELDDQQCLFDPKGILKQLVERDVNEIHTSPSAAVDAIWKDYGGSNNPDKEREEPTSRSHIKAPHDPASRYWRPAGLFGWVTDGITFCVVREEPAVKPFEGILDIDGAGSTFVDPAATSETLPDSISAYNESNDRASRRRLHMWKNACMTPWLKLSTSKTHNKKNRPPRSTSDAVLDTLQKTLNRDTTQWLDHRVVGRANDSTQKLMLHRRFVMPLSVFEEITNQKKDIFKDGPLQMFESSVPTQRLDTMFPMENARLYRYRFGERLHEPVVHLHQHFPADRLRATEFNLDLSIIAYDLQTMELYRYLHRLHSSTILNSIIRPKFPSSRVAPLGAEVRNQDIIDGNDSEQRRRSAEASIGVVSESSSRSHGPSGLSLSIPESSHRSPRDSISNPRGDGGPKSKSRIDLSSYQPYSIPWNDLEEIDAEHGVLTDADGVVYRCTTEHHERARDVLSGSLLPPPGHWAAKGPGGGPVVLVAATDASRMRECVTRAQAIKSAGIPCDFRQMPIPQANIRSFKKQLQLLPSVLMLVLLSAPEHRHGSRANEEIPTINPSDMNDPSSTALGSTGMSYTGHYEMGEATGGNFTSGGDHSRTAEGHGGRGDGSIGTKESTASSAGIMADRLDKLEQVLHGLSAHMARRPVLQGSSNPSTITLFHLRPVSSYFEFDPNVIPTRGVHPLNNYVGISKGKLSASWIYSRLDQMEERVEEFDSFGQCLSEIRRCLSSEPNIRRLRGRFIA